MRWDLVHEILMNVHNIYVGEVRPDWVGQEAEHGLG